MAFFARLGTTHLFTKGDAGGDWRQRQYVRVIVPSV